MSTFPRELAATDVAPKLDALVREVGRRLLDGVLPAHSVLRNQLTASRIERITLTGTGLFAYFACPVNTPLVTPADMMGGSLHLNVEGLVAGAGSLVKVVDGRLACVEIYTYAGQTRRASCHSAIRHRSIFGTRDRQFRRTSSFLAGFGRREHAGR